LRSLSFVLYFYGKRGTRRNEDMVRKVAAIILLVTALAASPASAWRKYAGEYNPSTGWPGVRVADDEGHVITVISFITPNVSFGVPYITLEETMDENDIATWNEFDKKRDPVVAKRVNGAAQALKVSRLKVYDYLPEEAWEKCGGHSAFVNHQVRVLLGYLKGQKYKRIEIEDYQVDPAMMGVIFEVDPIKDITEMGPVCWGYWYP
jgi:hypothetical protein